LEAIARQVLDVYEEVARPVRRKVPASISKPIPKRIGLLRHAYYPEDPRVRREVEALDEEGYDVDVFCLRRPGEPGFERVGNVEVRRLPMRHRRRGRLFYLFEYGTSFVLSAARLTVHGLRRRYDLVQVNTMPDFLVFAALGPKLQGVPILLDMHEVIPELYRSKYADKTNHIAVKVLTLVERLSARFATHVLTVSEATRDLIVGRSAHPERTTIVMNVADDRYFVPGRAPNPQPDSRDPPTFVSHGTLVPRYGFDVAIEAMDVLAARHVNARLRIVGEGEHGPGLRELVTRRGLESRVEFVGHCPLAKIASILAAADAGIVSNRSDVFTDLVLPTKLLEYVSMAIPAVVVRSPTISRYFADDEVFYFDSEDPEDLARAMGARAMAERTRERFRREHSWEATRATYLSIVERLCGGKSVRHGTQGVAVRGTEERDLMQVRS
jgi:glycosyltransferase involved in cell wall biosynthesis